MTDSSNTATSSSHMSLSTLVHPLPDPNASSIRPRNRRVATGDHKNETASTRTGSPGYRQRPEGTTSGNRGVSPFPSIGLGSEQPGGLGASPPGAYQGRGLLESSWTSGWATVQGMAAAFLTGDDDYNAPHLSQHGGISRSSALVRDYTAEKRKESDTWGPAPPRVGSGSIAAGSLSTRESALRAARTASVLESHEGVNGGPDISGRFKKRVSDELPRAEASDAIGEEQLVYIHHVQPTDTYAGIVLRYRCREDALKKTNGLWSTNDIQVRKWLAIPVDACEVKGKPCEPPSYYSRSVDLLASTPQASSGSNFQPSPFDEPQRSGDFFDLPTNGSSARQQNIGEEDRAWISVRWVAIEAFPFPVEIGRVPRKALGFFPPRRKKSLHTASTMSSPRESLDKSSPGRGPVDSTDYSKGFSSRRHSTLSSRPSLSSTPASARSKLGMDEADTRPVWMRRPGGVGSMGKSVRTPGPEKDYLNSWAKKHLPGLNIESLPSMSVMGSETASFGFGKEPAGIVESPFDEGRDITSTNRHGSGLDRAAAIVESWLRGAFANVKKPSTPILGPRRPIMDDSDLIELTDTNSDDGRIPSIGGSGHGASGLSNTVGTGVSRIGNGDGLSRDRSGSLVPRNKKGD